MKKTYSQSKAQVTRNWHIFDAKGKIVGRLATEIATILIGKDKPTYTPHIDGGDYVVVINSSQVKLSRTKMNSKIYYRHSHFQGGLKTETFAKLIVTEPNRVLREAVYSMLPKNRLRTGRMDRLKIFSDESHPHGTHFAK